MGFFLSWNIFLFPPPEVEHRRMDVIDVAIAYIELSVFHVRVWTDVEKNKTKYNDGGRRQNNDNSF